MYTRSDDLDTADRPAGNLSQRLRDDLENAILRAEYRPGEHLDEMVLARKFGVSRTPIREALGQLVAAGLLERRPRRGVVVASVSSERLVEMFEVMAEIEGFAARLAARRHSLADAMRLRESHERCRSVVASEDPDAYYYENELFHQAIFAASHSSFLTDQCMALGRRLKPYRRMQLEARNRVSNSFAEHTAVLEAILAHREQEADDLLRNHVLIQNERFSDLLAVLKQPSPVSGK
jgi:DNA-binding GntR family transcriptional regulator